LVAKAAHGWYMQVMAGGLLELSVDSDLMPPDHPEGFDPKRHAWLSEIDLRACPLPDLTLNKSQMGQSSSADGLSTSKTGSSDSSGMGAEDHELGLVKSITDVARYHTLELVTLKGQQLEDGINGALKVLSQDRHLMFGGPTINLVGHVVAVDVHGW
jgi:hypothetical protein